MSIFVYAEGELTLDLDTFQKKKLNLRWERPSRGIVLRTKYFHTSQENLRTYARTPNNALDTFGNLIWTRVKLAGKHNFRGKYS